MDKPFDPITGEGSLIPRERIKYYDNGELITYLAPLSMLELPVIQDLLEEGSVEKFVEIRLGGYTQEKHAEFSLELLQLRLDHDFEFYCYTCVQIPDKESEELIPFKLNRSQRRLIAKYERMRLTGVPIRLILAKARQWGGSTATQIYMNWIQLRHRMRWNMAICTLVNAQAAHIRNMLVRTIDNYPEIAGKYTLSNYGGFSTVKQINERDCIIGVGSTQAPENLRTYNIHMCHLSEVGSWGDTPKQSAKSLVQSLRGTIGNLPYTMVVLESSAKGVGNFFHKEWVSAKKGESGYEYMFVAWWEIEMYREEILDVKEFVKLLDGKYSDDGKTFWHLWELGASLESIKWYMSHKKRENMDDISMFQEFPSDDMECFSSTGNPAFNHIHIKKAAKNCEEPLWKGELVADDVKGKGAFRNLRFEESMYGNLWLWAKPDTTIKTVNRYALFSDIGGKHRLADYSCTKVLDRYPMIDGGVSEVCAVWHAHLDQDLFAWKSAQLAYWYNKGFWAIESNSLKEDIERSEGDHVLTVMDEIAPYYDNLYTRTDPEQIRQGLPRIWGFHTNKKTKPLLINTQNECLRDDLYIEKDIRAINQMYQYEHKDGKYGAIEGGNDDHVIITAGVNWLSLKYMPKCMEIKESTERRSPGIVSEATF